MLKCCCRNAERRGSYELYCRLQGDATWRGRNLPAFRKTRLLPSVFRGKKSLNFCQTVWRHFADVTVCATVTSNVRDNSVRLTITSKGKGQPITGHEGSEVE